MTILRHCLLGALAVAARAQAGEGTWAKHVLDLTSYPLAQCLDGSPGAFYISPGVGDRARSFVFHLQGECPRAQARKRASAQARKRASAQARKRASAQARKRASAQARKRAAAARTGP